jgi:hypothetical protein
MLLCLSASCPAAAVRAVATPRGGHQHRTSSGQRAAVYDAGDLEVAASETLTRRSRRRRRRADDERPMTSSAIVLASSSALLPARSPPPPPIPPPGAEDNPLRHVVDARTLWEMIEPHSRHLADEDCAHLRASIDVLLAKVAAILEPGPACGSPGAPHPSTCAPSPHPAHPQPAPASPAPWPQVETATSVIAEPISARAPPLLLGPEGLREVASFRGQDLDPRAELARGQALLAVLEGLNSAKSLLELRCDAPTAAAAMLSEAALTEA